MKRPLIFVTNDDGVNARGFAHALELAQRYGDVVAVAPENGQSGISHAISMSRPLFLRQVRKEPGLEVYACDGTPVDSVKMAFDYLLRDTPPDLAISGINHGSNSSVCVIYSGTMGAAVEASFYGIPSIGLSLVAHDHNADFTAALHYGGQIIETALHLRRSRGGVCLNVNFPDLPFGQIRGIMPCRQSNAFFRENFEPRHNPMGREYFWLTGDMINLESEATDTDEWALANGYVSVVPMQVDMTNHNQLRILRKALK